MATAAKTRETTVTTPSEREVVVTRDVAAPRALVFDAWTKPEHLPHWMLGPEGWTMPICEAELRPGGAYRYVWRKGDGAEIAIRGVHREIAPPERLVSTESWGEPWADTLNTLVLTERGGVTTMRVTLLYPSEEARDAALATGMCEGMTQGFARLDGYLRSLG